LSTSRLVVLLALFGAATALGCAFAGFTLARQSDERHAEEHRVALRETVAEFRGLFGVAEGVDPRFMRMIAQSAGLKNLRFDRDPASDVRDIQPVVSTEGRIVGFLTWEPDAPMTELMQRLMPFIAATAFGLVGFAGFSLRQLHRSRIELVASEERARRVAEEDVLTGLPNRRKMLALLDEAMVARIGQKPLTFALFELSGLYDIDEEIGMIRREEFLAEAILGTKAHLPANATLGRMGTTEFAVICDGDVEAGAMLRGVIRAIADLRHADSDVRIRTHGGYAQAPRDATGSEELVRCARLALRAASEKGPGAVFAFEHSIDVTSRDQHFIRRELPRALEANSLDLHYQPILASDGSRITGVEALLRWTHPERGPIGPASFIPVAEQMGLMDALGAFVLRRALSDAKRWPELYIAVNLSPVQVRDRRVVDLVREALVEAGVEASRLMLEITEGVLIDNPEQMIERIAELHALGVRIALDDFGSGYSNLGYLQRFAFDKLKVDRSFVSALGRSPNAGVIIQAIVALGRALGVTVVVEGVETEEQRVLLRLAGCDEMQGFLFAKPAPAKSIDRLVSQRRNNKVASRAVA
jgi:predicted signal transduction protein with EAL and GGDEF domain